MQRHTTIITLLISIIMSSCSTTQNSGGKRLPAFDKQGHRGCRGLAPENTIPAMYKAIDLGVTTLEMDIVFTKDNVAILSHEPFFNHEISSYSSGKPVESKEEKKLNIYSMTFAETQQYDVGLKPHARFPEQQKMAVHKPSLASLIDSVEAYVKLKSLKKPFYNIETKTTALTDNLFHPAPDRFVDMLMEVINSKGIADRTIIQSFDYRTLQYLHQRYPEIKTALLVEADDKNSFRKQIKDLGFTPTIYSPEFTLVTAELVKNCHKQKMKIIPWTVNDKKKIEELRTLKVDGIISDFPNLFNESGN